ncbi:MAG: ABC transporter permease [Candidatus Kryptoniota bacterium]
MSLFSLEIQKTFLRLRTYIGFAAIFIAVVLLEVIFKISHDSMVRTIAGVATEDFIMSGNILNVWTITAFIMNSLYIHVPFLIALVAGDMVSSEATGGTIRFLLIRPPSRSKIIFYKYLTMLFYTAVLLIFMSALCIGLGLVLFGNGDAIRIQTEIPHIVILPAHIAASRTLLAFLAAILSMSVVGSLAFLLSTIAENSVGPIIGSMAVMIVFLIVGNLPFDTLAALRPYLFTTYMNIWQLFLNEPIYWNRIAKDAGALLFHDALFFIISYYVFLKKDIKS